MAELDSEGQRYSIGSTPPTQVLRLNSRGNAVVELQFLLNFIGQFYNEIPFVIEDSVFRESTRDAVIAFQRRFGLTADGVVGPATWNRLYEVYRRIRATTPQPHPPGGTPNVPAFPGAPIQIGTRSSDVSTMQTRLNTVARCNPSIETLVVDGVFGQRTQQAVREFQRLFGLPQNGIIDQNTWYRIIDESNLLQGAPCPAPPQPPPPPPTVWPPFPGVILREGMTGPSIRQVQERLNVLGANPRLSEDGIFGPRTAAAVRAFQQQRGLNADGIVGPITWNALFGATAPPPPPQPVWPPFPGVILREGMTGPSIRQVQERLNVLGANPRLSEDGIFGPRTAAAVRAFQQQRGLNANGIVDTITWNAIFTNITRAMPTIATINAMDTMDSIDSSDSEETVQTMILTDPKPPVVMPDTDFEVFVPTKSYRQSKNRNLIYFLILMLMLNDKNEGIY